MHEEWTDKLSEYLDDELSPREREAVESHLRGCAECAAVLDDLTRVVERAQRLDRRPPRSDLWDGIAARIETRGAAPRRVSFTLPQLAAAAVLLIAVSAGIAWEFADRSRSVESSRFSVSSTQTPDRDPSTSTESSRASSGDEPSGARPDVAMVSFADAQYDAAVSDLEKALQNGRGRLDKTTIAIVEHNLQIIDQAIEQARQALEADPANDYLSGHLVDARRRKLDLLRRAAALTTESD
jgi:hypothetical protein